MNPSDRRAQLYAMLGQLPPRDRPLRVLGSTIQQHDDYQLESLLLDLNGAQPVPAYFVKPLHATGRLPTILYMHAHGGEYKIGKDELLHGRKALWSEPYAKALTAAGYAAFCIDHWAFGERATATEQQTFKLMLWRGQVLWGMMMYDSLRAVDYVASRGDVDASRLATLGISMGSTLAFWLAALDPRIKVCIDLCCLSDYQALIDTGAFDIHALYYYVPNLLNHFTASDINGLIAPRPHLSLAGTQDKLTPIAGLDIINRDLTQTYRRAGAPDAWRQSRYDVGHQETAEMRTEVMAFLKKWL